MTQIIVSVISGLLTLAGVCVTAWFGAKRTRDEVTARLSTAQAVTDCKLDALTREVRAHNEFARRVPVLESQMQEHARRLGALEAAKTAQHRTLQ